MTMQAVAPEGLGRSMGCEAAWRVSWYKLSLVGPNFVPFERKMVIAALTRLLCMFVCAGVLRSQYRKEEDYLREMRANSE